MLHSNASSTALRAVREVQPCTEARSERYRRRRNYDSADTIADTDKYLYTDAGFGYRFIY